MSICHECGGTMTKKSAAGLRWQVIPGVPMDVPPSIEVVRCDSCDDYALTAAEVARIEEALEPEARRWMAEEVQRAVRCLKAREGVTTAELESALGVGHTYLSHASNPSTGKVSLPLLRLLQAFVACPEELRRHRERRPSPSYQPLSGVTATSQPGGRPFPSRHNNARTELRTVFQAGAVTNNPYSEANAPEATEPSSLEVAA